MSGLVGGGIGAALSYARNHFTQPDISNIPKVAGDAHTLTMNFLHSIIGSFQGCQVSEIGLPDALTYNVSCADPNNAGWNQLSALTAAASGLQTFASNYHDNFMSYSDGLVGFAFNTFVENIGIDAFVFAAISFLIYRSYQNSQSREKELLNLFAARSNPPQEEKEDAAHRGALTPEQRNEHEEQPNQEDDYQLSQPGLRQNL